MRKLHYFLSVLACVTSGIDGYIKAWAIAFLPPVSQSRDIIALALHKNPGIAFDIPIPFWIIAPCTILIVAFVSRFGWRMRHTTPMATVGAILLISGAGNNFIDRAANGFTTDYLILLGTTAINLSDILIILGALLLIRYTQPHPQARTF